MRDYFADKNVYLTLLEDKLFPHRLRHLFMQPCLLEITNIHSYFATVYIDREYCISWDVFFIEISFHIVATRNNYSIIQLWLS